MAHGNKCLPFCLINGDGTFNVTEANTFSKKVKLGESGLSYAVVSIMGPQSSGKSTLLNHLFHTNFREMDASKGRQQTTKGIWLGKCIDIEPCTLAMDLEGTDGIDRGEDDTAFEKQSALFALAISDIVIINMWCHDIGRERASNIPLLKTVFQVMIQLLHPRKVTLLFVLRDETRTPLVLLETNLKEAIQKIWDSVQKPSATDRGTLLSDFLEVQIRALPSYEYAEDRFKEQVATLKQWIFQHIAHDVVDGDRSTVVPADGFFKNAQQIWELIKANKDLDLPAQKVLVSEARCKEIAIQKYDLYGVNKLKGFVESGPLPGFGGSFSWTIEMSLQEYDEETLYYVESVRIARRNKLEQKMLKVVIRAYQIMLTDLRKDTLIKFKEKFNETGHHDIRRSYSSIHEECAKWAMAIFDEGYAGAPTEQEGWNPSKDRIKLWDDMKKHVRNARVKLAAKIVAVAIAIAIAFKLAAKIVAPMAVAIAIAIAIAGSPMLL